MEISANGTLDAKPSSQNPPRLITQIIGETRDKTAMIILEDKLAEQRKISLQKFKPVAPSKMLQKRPGSFASALVHEVRNPLSNINLAVDILDSASLDEEHKIFVDVIKRGAARINNILSEFLLSLKKEEIHSEICSVTELLEEVLALNKDRMLLKNVSVSKDYTHGVINILVNKEEIKIALTNIIINAIEAMPAEHGSLNLYTKNLNDKCVIEIQDNGIGISETNLKNIFDPFFTNKNGGMGLGLSTTLDILLSNCATLDVHSAEGSGTCFTLFFNQVAEV